MIFWAQNALWRHQFDHQQSNGNLEIAGKVQKVAQIHDSVWPEEPQQGSGVLGGFRVYSQQTVIAVDVREPDSQSS